MKMITLSNGYQLPNICYGTDIISNDFTEKNKIKRYLKIFGKSVLYKEQKKYQKGKGIIDCLNHALEYKCNFFDTSRAYGASERILGNIFQHVPRKDYYICTKLCNYDQLHDIPARKCLQTSMMELKTDYIDLYLLHWPVEGKFLDYWKQLEELYDEGLVKSIGVSNCKIHHLESIKNVARIIPMVDEVELHPLLTEKELLDYCNINRIQVMAYSSTARQDFRLLCSRRLEEVCKKYNKTVSQIILRWHIQNGVVPLFNSSSIKHFQNNMDIFDFNLSIEDMKIIDSLNINSRTRYDSDNCEWDRL